VFTDYVRGSLPPLAIACFAVPLQLPMPLADMRGAHEPIPIVILTMSANRE